MSALLVPWDVDETPDQINVASWLSARAAERPAQDAIVEVSGRPGGEPRWSSRDYAALDAASSAIAFGLKEGGVKRGDRVLVAIQGGRLIALVYALFKMGAVPVMIDPGMGRKGLLACVAHARPTALVGIARAHLARLLFGSAFKSVERVFLDEPSLFFRAPSLARFPEAAEPYPTAETERDELAAVLFTSGSTGTAKGVHYTHGIFDAQVRAIGRMYGIKPGEVEVPCFPLFSLFSIALGMTCVLPDIDPTKPAEADPDRIAEAIAARGAVSAFGSPAIWRNVARHWDLDRSAYRSMRRLMTAGAPIHPNLHAEMSDVLPDDAEVHVPYGATESLPVASLSSRSIDDALIERTRTGDGLCVGELAPHTEVRIAAVVDGPLADWSEAVELEPGQVGEICVASPVVTPAYDGLPEKTALAKIRGEDGRLWHRMGDVGFIAEDGRLWYGGRKAHRVETAQGTLYSVQLEAAMEARMPAHRFALVGVGPRGAERAYLLVQGGPSKQRAIGTEVRESVERELEQTRFAGLVDRVIAYPSSFPVDRRHNAKIHREELAAWAAEYARA